MKKKVLLASMLTCSDRHKLTIINHAFGFEVRTLIRACNLYMKVRRSTMKPSGGGSSRPLIWLLSQLRLCRASLPPASFHSQLWACHGAHPRIQHHPIWTLLTRCSPPHVGEVRSFASWLQQTFLALIRVLTCRWFICASLSRFLR